MKLLSLFQFSPVVIQLGNIAAIEASCAQTAASCLLQIFKRQKAKRIGLDIAAELCFIHARADQLGLGRRIYAIETREADHRRSDAHMHFQCAGFPKQLHDAP